MRPANSVTAHSVLLCGSLAHKVSTTNSPHCKDVPGKLGEGWGQCFVFVSVRPVLSEASTGWLIGDGTFGGGQGRGGGGSTMGGGGEASFGHFGRLLWRLLSGMSFCTSHSCTPSTLLPCFGND